jgi:hypothetical protein
MGYGLSVLGGLFFLLAVGQLHPGSLSMSRSLMHLAGWFVTVGWVMQRAEEGRWPFKAGSPALSVIRKAVSEFCLPIALLLLLFAGVVLLVGLLLTPFVLFVFQKLF